jgi:hypothetical protein
MSRTCFCSGIFRQDSRRKQISCGVSFLLFVWYSQTPFSVSGHISKSGTAKRKPTAFPEVFSETEKLMQNEIA